MGRSKELLTGADNEHVRQSAELIIKNIDRLGELFELRYPDEYLESAADRVARGSLIVLAGNHISHVDVIPLVLAADAITVAANKKIETGQYPRQEQFTGFEIPVAASVATGDQGEFISYFYEKSKDWLEGHNVRFVPISRGKYTHKEMGTLRELGRLRRRIEDNIGLAIFPEGTVQGGRYVPGSIERYGIIPVTEPTIMSDLVLNSRQEREIVFVPIGNSESYDIFDPNTKLPTAATLRVLGQYHDVGSVLTRLATATMGRPFGKSDLDIPDFETRRAPIEAHQMINMQVLERISHLLPDGEKGVFRQT